MKIKWLWFAIIIGILLLAMAVAAQTTGRSPELTQFYNDTNVKYFGARLPSGLVMLDKSINPPDLGVTVPCGEHCYTITVFSYWVPDTNEQRMVVLHEMCHVDLEETNTVELDMHGPAFQACMRKLAAEGAFDKLW